MTAVKRKIDRDEIYQRIVQMIKDSGQNKAEVSSSELADEFGVQPPTMDYHLKKLIDDGKLITSKKRGRYNRRIFMLPEKTEIKKIFKKDDKDELKIFLQKKLKEKEVQDKIEETKEIQEVDTVQEEVNTVQKPKDMVQDPVQKLDSFKKVSVLEKKAQPVLDDFETKDQEEVKELTLDEKIERFLEESNKVPTAEHLLTTKDRELLSVMNETIHQSIVYLKDLSEQLTTVQNKELIQQLIDERNSYLKEFDRLKEENESLKKQLQEASGKFDLDPGRLRLMQQNMINILDMYLDQPNHTLALSRREFRSAMTKQINDLFRYILNLEK